MRQGKGRPLLSGSLVTEQCRQRLSRRHREPHSQFLSPKQSPWYRPSKRERLHDESENGHPLGCFLFLKLTTSI